MRIVNKGGVTPCDRRLDRRKVAIAATAAVLLFATTAQAGYVHLSVVPAASTIGLTISVTDPALPGGPATFGPITTYGPIVPYSPGPTSTVATAWGNIFMTYTPGVSLAFSPETRVNYFNSGIYIPGRLPNTDLPDTGLSPANAHPGQMGHEITHPIAGLLGYSQLWNMWSTFGTLDAGTGVTTPDGGVPFAFTGGTTYTAIPGPDPDGAGPMGAQAQSLLAMDGWLDVVSGILVDTVQLNELASGDTPFPNLLAGNTATFDGTTLTVPLSSVLVFPSGTSTYTITTSGTLVAVVVPEPSTMILFGFSVVGLLSYAWRARKRRAA